MEKWEIVMNAGLLFTGQTAADGQTENILVIFAGDTRRNNMETAWLIEKEDDKNKGFGANVYLGAEDQGKIQGLQISLVWTTPDQAIRFSRKIDAESTSRALLGSDAKLIFTEHQWD